MSDIENITPHLCKKTPAIVEVHQGVELVFVCREIASGKLFNIHRLFHYNIHVSKDGIQLIQQTYIRLLGRAPHLSTVDKLVLVHLYQSNLLPYYSQCAARVRENSSMIKEKLRLGRIIIDEDYSALCKSGFKYAIANYLPYKDELIDLYSAHGF